VCPTEAVRRSAESETAIPVCRLKEQEKKEKRGEFREACIECRQPPKKKQNEMNKRHNR
jgi:hypothetical protein